MRLLNELSHQVAKAKAEREGKALSQSRRLLPLEEIDPSSVGAGQAQQTKHLVRMLDGQPMQYFSDGSLRHPLGRAVARSKAVRKALKRARRRQR
jgi:hypothetical protein